jgi:hypothetical protein
MKCTLLAWILLIFNTLNGQNIFFKSNQSGTDLGFQIGSSSGLTLYGVNASYTNKGRITGSLNFGYANNNNDKISSTSIGPQVDILGLKQGENKAPVSINLGLGYQFNTIMNDLTKESLDSHTILFNVGLFYEGKPNPNISIIPSFTIVYAKSSGNSAFININDHATAITIATAFLFNKFFVTPAISASDGNNSFSIGFGLIFPQD